MLIAGMELDLLFDRDLLLGVERIQVLFDNVVIEVVEDLAVGRVKRKFRMRK